MSHSKHSRKGYMPTQQAGSDSPWLMENKRRADEQGEADLDTCERCGTRGGGGYELDDHSDYPDDYFDTPKSWPCPDCNSIEYEKLFGNFERKAMYPNEFNGL